MRLCVLLWTLTMTLLVCCSYWTAVMHQTELYLGLLFKLSFSGCRTTVKICRRTLYWSVYVVVLAVGANGVAVWLVSPPAMCTSWFTSSWAGMHTAMQSCSNAVMQPTYSNADNIRWKCKITTEPHDWCGQIMAGRFASYFNTPPNGLQFITQWHAGKSQNYVKLNFWKCHQ